MCSDGHLCASDSRLPSFTRHPFDGQSVLPSLTCGIFPSPGVREEDLWVRGAGAWPQASGRRGMGPQPLLAEQVVLPWGFCVCGAQLLPESSLSLASTEEGQGVSTWTGERGGGTREVAGSGSPALGSKSRAQAGEGSCGVASVLSLHERRRHETPLRKMSPWFWAITSVTLRGRAHYRC